MKTFHAVCIGVKGRCILTNIVFLELQWQQPLEEDPCAMAHSFIGLCLMCWQDFVTSAGTDSVYADASWDRCSDLPKHDHGLIGVLLEHRHSIKQLLRSQAPGMQPACMLCCILELLHGSILPLHSAWLSD